MGIEEFIWTYSTDETDKIMRKNVIQKYSNKAQIQKIVDMTSVARRENSPIRSPQKPRPASPTRGDKYYSGRTSPYSSPYRY